MGCIVFLGLSLMLVFMSVFMSTVLVYTVVFASTLLAYAVVLASAIAFYMSAFVGYLVAFFFLMFM